MLTTTALNLRYGATLVKIPHQSLNASYVGFSERFGQPIFVKQFAPGQTKKWQAETAITEQMSDWLLAFDAKTRILVRQDLPFMPVEKLDQALASDMGRVLADYHRRVQPFPGIQDNYRAIEMLATISDPQLVDGARWFQAHAEGIEVQLQAVPAVVRHGDVGLRNYRYLNGQLCLIDYERAQLGMAQQDFIKLFYQDFQSDQVLIQAFLSGYGELAPVPELTWMYTIFITVVGIFNYVRKVSDPAFLAVGQRMLRDVRNYIQQSEAKHDF